MFDRSGLGRSRGFGAAVETIRDQAFLLRERVYLFGTEKNLWFLGKALVALLRLLQQFMHPKISMLL